MVVITLLRFSTLGFFTLGICNNFYSLLKVLYFTCAQFCLRTLSVSFHFVGAFSITFCSRALWSLSLPRLAYAQAVFLQV
jgi:hypothetical protein